MHFTYHYSLIGKSLNSTIALLESYGIQCIVSLLEHNPGVVHVVADVEQTHPCFDEIIAVLPSRDYSSKDFPDVSHVGIQYFPVFSDEEYCNAQWLSVRSSFSKVHSYQSVCKEWCEVGKNQWGTPKMMHVTDEGTYVVCTGVKWRRNHFASSSAQERGLFCDDAAKKIMSLNQIQGVEFRPVMNHKTQSSIDDLYQMVHTFTIPSEGIIGISRTEDYFCNVCGMKMLTFEDNRFRYAIQSGCIPDGIDFCRTPPMFVLKSVMAHAYDCTLVSQKLYKLIKDNMLDRSLWFEPIDVIGRIPVSLSKP